MSMAEKGSIKATGRAFGRSIVAISLAGALMIVPGVSIGVSPAFAAQGSVTINAPTGDSSTNTYDVYQIFTADIEAGTNGQPDTASNFAWNSSMQTPVVNFLTSQQMGDAYGFIPMSAADAANPQKAAEFIASEISETSTGATPQAGSFAEGLAKALASETPTGTATSGTAYQADEGYYLFVSNSSAVAEGEAGTAAIWVPLGGSTTSINQKSAVPTVNKQVKEDSTDTYGKAADADKDQAIAYRLTGTMPSNIDAFETYHYCFTDTLPTGKMSLVGDSTSTVTVKVVNGQTEYDVTSQLGASNITFASGVLTVNIADLKNLTVPNSDPAAKIAINADTQVIVDYQAYLNGSSVIGATGNPNEVELTYTADPVHYQDKGGLTSTANAFTYELDVVKVDKQVGTPVQGAKYTMQVSGSNPAQYVQADGSLGSTAYEFTTGADGKFTVPRIDEGTYVIHESSPANGYKSQAADITVVISSTLDQTTGSCTALSATVTGGESATAPNIATHLATAADASMGVNAPDVSTGIVGAVTSDPKETPMPITGMDGVTTAVVGGTIAIALGGLVLFLTRKRRGEDVGSEA